MSVPLYLLHSAQVQNYMSAKYTNLIAAENSESDKFPTDFACFSNTDTKSVLTRLNSFKFEISGRSFLINLFANIQLLLSIAPAVCTLAYVYAECYVRMHSSVVPVLQQRVK